MATPVTPHNYNRSASEDPHSRRITIWHKQERRKIVGNAAPMAKNLQDYLAKHSDCEIYVNQDHEGASEGAQSAMDPLRPTDAIEMILTDDGERAFYAAHRGKPAAGPVFIPGAQPQNDGVNFPRPPAFMMHHSPHTLATQPPPLWTRMSPEPDGAAKGAAMIAKSPTMPVDVTGVPNMSPPDNQSMAGSLDSLGDVTFEVDMSNSSYTGGASIMQDLEDGDVFVLEDESGFTMELSGSSRNRNGDLEVEVWVSESMTVADYEQFMSGTGDAIEFDDEEANMLEEMQHEQRHDRHGFEDSYGSSSGSVQLQSFQPMVKHTLEGL